MCCVMGEVARSITAAMMVKSSVADAGVPP